jgi:branched-chain amino acid transport system permease protein
MKTPLKTLGAAVLLTVVFTLPSWASRVTLNLLTETAYYALFAVSFNLLLGHTGLLSFGHAAYLGIGAYTFAILCKNMTGLPIVLSVLAAGLMAGLGGVVAGYFCTKLKGAFFALLTLAFNQFFYAIALKWRAVTGGDDGISLMLPAVWVPGLGSVNLAKSENAYYFVVIVVGICLLSIWHLTQTPLGNTIRAIKANEQRAEFIGFNTFVSKWVIFSIASFYAGIAGGLYALHQRIASTAVIDLHRSTEAIFMTFIGGVGSFFGPILGAGIYLVFTDWVSRITDRWGIILGILFILIVMYVHKGVVGTLAAPLVAKLQRILRPNPLAK